MEDTTSDSARTFATRLTKLINARRMSDGAPWTSASLARALTSRGVPTTHSYISQLRNGQRDNPTMTVVQAIAGVFEVPPAYFFDDQLSAQLEEELELASALHAAGIRGVALRAVGLDPASLQMTRLMLDEVRRLQGLPPVGSTD